LNNRLEYGATSEAARQTVIEQLLAAKIPRDMFEVVIGKPPVLEARSRAVK